MLRLFGLLLMASGCDLAFGFDLAEEPAICGPFGAPEPVVFASPELDGARDFSVDATGRLGMVHVTRTNAQGTTWTGPHAIKPDGAGTWIPDDERDRPNLDRLDGGHVVETGNVFGWIDGSSTTGSTLQELAFAPGVGMWGQVPGLIDGDITSDNHVGNVVHVQAGPGLVNQLLVEIKLQRSGDSRENQIFIFRRIAGRDWELTSQANPLNSIDERIDPTAGVLTSDQGRLVYAAKVGEATTSRLYATRRDDNTFLPGLPLSIRDVPADADLTEPWIDNDCGTLYFRWNDTTWMTSSLDESSAGQ